MQQFYLNGIISINGHIGAVSMTDKDKKDILSNLDSKIVKYIGKKIMEDVESQIDDLLPNKETSKEDNNIKKTEIIDKSTQQENPNKDNKEEIKEEKSIIASMDDKLDELIGKNTSQEIEEDLLSFIPGHVDNVDDLGSKLDSFLTETNHYGIEHEENTTREARDTEQKFTNQKMEAELERLKQNLKTGNKNVEKKQTTNKDPKPEKTDKAVEKKFKDKEIDDALAALKAKCSIKKEQSESKTIQKEDIKISNEEIDTSLQDLLKNLDK